MMLPKDPFMLYSLINTKLRDEYSSLDELCASLDIDKAEIEKKLTDAGFRYEPSLNQFK
ncbi:MAG: DUF4250 domain-containing protein [Candidatus Amulumruptor caecigallinarius]|nr:DUF4250 domain-containing protein [Candidatus Amulumruptor caecigallinarius]